MNLKVVHTYVYYILSALFRLFNENYFINYHIHKKYETTYISSIIISRLSTIKMKIGL